MSRAVASQTAPTAKTSLAPRAGFAGIFRRYPRQKIAKLGTAVLITEPTGHANSHSATSGAATAAMPRGIASQRHLAPSHAMVIANGPMAQATTSTKAARSPALLLECPPCPADTKA